MTFIGSDITLLGRDVTVEGLRVGMAERGVKIQIFRDENDLQVAVFEPTPKLLAIITDAITTLQLLPSSAVPRRLLPSSAPTPPGQETPPGVPRTTSREQSASQGSIHIQIGDLSNRRGPRGRQADMAKAPSERNKVISITTPPRGQRSATRAIDSSEPASPVQANHRLDDEQDGDDEGPEPRAKRVRRTNRPIIPDSQESAPADGSFEAWSAEVKRKTPDKVLNEAFLQLLQGKAELIGGKHAIRDWRQLMSLWRSNASLNANAASQEMDSGVPTGPEEPAITEFRQTYQAIRSARTVDLFRGIHHRCQMVALDDLYHRAEIPIFGPADRGQTIVSRRKRYIFNCLYPAWRGFDFPKNKRTGRLPTSADHGEVIPSQQAWQQWTHFGDTLGAAARWKELTQAFGFGVLALIPSEIGNNWIEHSLRGWQFAIWIEAIWYFNPRVKRASAAWSRRLQRAIGGSAPPRRLQLEDVSHEVIEGHREPQLLWTADVPTEDDEGSEQVDEATTQGNLQVLFQPVQQADVDLTYNITQMGAASPLMHLWPVEDIPGLSQDSNGSWGTEDSFGSSVDFGELDGVAQYAFWDNGNGTYNY